MGQVLHGGAATTAAIRRAIQHGQESLRGLAQRYGINPKTVAKWRSRISIQDLPTRPKQARSTVLSTEDEAVVVAFAALDEKATRSIAGDFLRALIKAVPYTIHTVLTDNGTHFTSPGNTGSAASGIMLRRGVGFADLGAHDLDRITKHSTAKRLVRRLDALGYGVMHRSKVTA